MIGGKTGEEHGEDEEANGDFHDYLFSFQRNN